MDLEQLARYLDQAAFEARSVAQLEGRYSISLEDAYKIQELSIAERLKRGERLMGYKMGFTSRAKMEQMGIHDLIWGRLTSKMCIENKGEIAFSDFIHPRVEPEIAFRISEDIDRELPLEELVNVVDGLAGAIELIDSRYENFKFTLEDVIADNCSSAAYVIGDWKEKDTPIEDIKMSIDLDDLSLHKGSSKAILDNPWNSLQEATRLITAFGDTIKKGQVILAGAATPAVYVKTKQKATAQVEGFGEIELNIN